MHDIAYARGNIARIGNTRYRDSAALEFQGVYTAVYIALNRNAHLGAWVALKARADNICSHTTHILTLDSQNLIANLHTRLVRGCTLIGLGENDIVATLAYQRANTAILARSEHLEVGHITLRQILRVGVGSTHKTIYRRF